MVLASLVTGCQEEWHLYKDAKMMKGTQAGRRLWWFLVAGRGDGDTTAALGSPAHKGEFPGMSQESCVQTDDPWDTGSTTLTPCMSVSLTTASIRPEHCPAQGSPRQGDGGPTQAGPQGTDKSCGDIPGRIPALIASEGAAISVLSSWAGWSQSIEQR